MLDTAFPTHVNQQAGWQALKRVHDAYARIARTIQPTIVEALRATPMRLSGAREQAPGLRDGDLERVRPPEG